MWCFHSAQISWCWQATCREAADDAFTEELGLPKSQYLTAAEQFGTAVIDEIQVCALCVWRAQLTLRHLAWQHALSILLHVLHARQRSLLQLQSIRLPLV